MKPFYRKHSKAWYVKINGKFIRLDKDKEAAFQKFYKLMADRAPTTDDSTVESLVQKFLTWLQQNRAEATYTFYNRFLKTFIPHLHAGHGKLTLGKLKVHHVEAWLSDVQGHTSGNNRNAACRAIAGCFNWAVKKGHISVNPVKHVERPPASPRTVYYDAKQMAQIMDSLRKSDPLRDFITLLVETGCRPQELRAAEARHFDRNRLVFPKEEAKGKLYPRTIRLNARALPIIQRAVLKHPHGPLLRNNRGNRWTPGTLKIRFRSISKRLGFRVFVYGIRHTFCSNALLNGLDPVTVATLMGHRDASMVLRVYQALDLAGDHMDKAADKATGIPPNDKRESA